MLINLSKRNLRAIKMRNLTQTHVPCIAPRCFVKNYAFPRRHQKSRTPTPPQYQRFMNQFFLRKQSTRGHIKGHTQRMCDRFGQMEKKGIYQLAIARSGLLYTAKGVALSNWESQPPLICLLLACTLLLLIEIATPAECD